MLTNLQLADACIEAYTRSSKSADDVEFLYIEDPDHHIFVIRGTEASKFFSGRGWMDVMRDLAIWPKSFAGAHGHAGFVQGWDAILDDVAEYIASDPEKPIVLAGHSLGGAIAIVGAYSMIESEYPVAKVVTFGAPRSIAEKNEFDEFHSKLFMVTAQYQNTRDPITALMRWSCYSHIRSIFINGEKRAPWYRRRIACHKMSEYRDLISEK